MGRGAGGGKGGDQGEHAARHTYRTQSRARVSQGLRRIRQAVRQYPSQRLTALFHHLTVDCLREAYFALKRDAAPGVDGVTWDRIWAGLGAPASGLA